MRINNEIIICAAVLYNGIVVTGRRHRDCNNTIELLVNKSGTKLPDREDQGFMTSVGRYVDRKEAFKIAKANNQLIHKMFDYDEEGVLTSEDLY